MDSRLTAEMAILDQKVIGNTVYIIWDLDASVIGKMKTKFLRQDGPMWQLYGNGY